MQFLTVSSWFAVAVAEESDSLLQLKSLQYEELQDETDNLQHDTEQDSTIGTSCDTFKSVPLNLQEQVCPPHSFAAQLPGCDKVECNGLCEGDGECDTNPHLNNCGWFDIYTKRCHQGSQELGLYGEMLLSFKADTEGVAPVKTGKKIFLHEGINLVRWNHASGQVFEAESWEEYALRVAASLEAGAGYNKVLVSVTARAEMQWDMMSTGSAKQYRKEEHMHAGWMEATNSFNQGFVKKLTQRAHSDFKDRSAAWISQEYGDFYADKIMYGGDITHTTQVSMSEGETKQQVSMELGAEGQYMAKTASVAVTGSVDSSRRVGDRMSNRKFGARGCDAKIFLSATVANFDAKKEEWVASCNDVNAYPIRWELKPLWDLVAAVDFKKGSEMREATLCKHNRNWCNFCQPENCNKHSDWTWEFILKITIDFDMIRDADITPNLRQAISCLASKGKMPSDIVQRFDDSPGALLDKAQVCYAKTMASKKPWKQAQAQGYAECCWLKKEWSKMWEKDFRSK